MYSCTISNYLSRGVTRDRLDEFAPRLDETYVLYHFELFVRHGSDLSVCGRNCSMPVVPRSRVTAKVAASWPGLTERDIFVQVDVP